MNACSPMRDELSAILARAPGTHHQVTHWYQSMNKLNAQDASFNAIVSEIYV